MQLWGYRSDESASTENLPPLAEVTMTATPSELRQVAQFLIDCATKMESMGAAYSHQHLSDKQSGFNASPHFVVFSSAESAG